MRQDTAQLLEEVTVDTLIIEPVVSPETARVERHGWWQPLVLASLFAASVAGYGLIIFALDLDLLRLL